MMMMASRGKTQTGIVILCPVRSTGLYTCTYITINFYVHSPQCGSPQLHLSNRYLYVQYGRICGERAVWRHVGM